MCFPQLVVSERSSRFQSRKIYKTYKPVDYQMIYLQHHCPGMKEAVSFRAGIVFLNGSCLGNGL